MGGTIQAQEQSSLLKEISFQLIQASGELCLSRGRHHGEQQGDQDPRPNPSESLDRSSTTMTSILSDGQGRVESKWNEFVQLLHICSCLLEPQLKKRCLPS